MTKQDTNLEACIESGKPITIVEMSPPKGCDPEAVRRVAKRCTKKVHALGISDNREDVRMSALAAASLVVSAGVEPILHVVTRDQNRTALVSTCLGAQALGVRNLLCTTGTHQTLGRFREARGVFDIDSVQLLEMVAGLATNGSLVGEEKIEGVGPFCLGAVASPFADPIELQIMKLSKKVTAGARFLITQPVFDRERFETWWSEVTRQGLHEKVAIVAGIQVLSSSEDARARAGRRPSPRIPDALLARLAAKPDLDAQRAEGGAIAVETIEKLSGLKGLRGFEIRDDAGGESALEIVETCGLGGE